MIDLSVLLEPKLWIKAGVFVAILIVGWIAGRVIGGAVNRAVDRTLEPAFIRTDVGRAFKEAGIDISAFAGGIVKAFIVIVALIVALRYVGLMEIKIIEDVAYYLPMLLGGIAVATIGLVLVSLLADYLGNIISKLLPEVGPLFKNMLLLGLVAIVVTLALKLIIPQQLPLAMKVGNVEISVADIIYPLILGIAFIGYGLIVGNSIANQAPAEMAPYVKILVALIFLVAGIGAIFATYPGVTAIIEKLSWGIAIAFALTLIPALAKLVRQAFS